MQKVSNTFVKIRRFRFYQSLEKTAIVCLQFVLFVLSFSDRVRSNQSVQNNYGNKILNRYEKQCYY